MHGPHVIPLQQPSLYVTVSRVLAVELRCEWCSGKSPVRTAVTRVGRHQVHACAASPFQAGQPEGSCAEVVKVGDDTQSLQVPFLVFGIHGPF